jgi:hypothetical protein
MTAYVAIDPSGVFRMIGRGPAQDIDAHIERLRPDIVPQIKRFGETSFKLRVGDYDPRWPVR